MSRLYRNLGWAGAGPLFEVTLDEDMTLGDDDLMSISTHRGGSDPSTHTPSTAHVHAARRVGLTSRSLSIRLTSAAASFLATRGYTTAAAIRDRFRGRRGATTAHDTARLGWRTTELMAASWDSVLLTSPDTWTPHGGAWFSAAVASSALNPTWSPASAVFDGAGASDAFRYEGEPMTAREILQVLAQRLHLFVGERSGRLMVRTLPVWRTRAAAAVDGTWPLSRSHVIAPTTWRQPHDSRREYALTIRRPGYDQTIITAEGGVPTGEVILEELDWTDTIAHTDHWERIYGINISSNHLSSWSVPSVVGRLDKLIGSDRENDRRAAGMLLGLEVGDALPLAGDWPTQLAGIAYVGSISEQITPTAWTITLGLTPTRWIDGSSPVIPKPRSWNQSRGTWNDATTATWHEGVPL